MIQHFETILSAFFQSNHEGKACLLFDPAEQLAEESTNEAEIARALNSAFLIALTGNTHPAAQQAKNYLDRMKSSPDWTSTAEFYLNGIPLIHREIETACRQDPGFSENLRSLAAWVTGESNRERTQALAEKIWAVFFPEAVAAQGKKEERIEALRDKRTVSITELNPAPIRKPARELLITSNILLTLPTKIDVSRWNEEIRTRLASVAREPQLYWYDHPIPLDVDPDKNEALYGLRRLDEALEFEISRGNLAPGEKLPCLLSVSVTHRGLQDIAREYLEGELNRSGGLQHLDVYLFTETATRQIIEKILAPAAAHYLREEKVSEILNVFGVDGAYGRHYSFLKAVTAFWSLLIQPDIQATFKIDLDQVFPQEKLVEETGASALEHFLTPLWGARGGDSDGQPLELGMIAGALVNQNDIEKSLFTPDVPFPNRTLSPDEYIFFSTLPQALSTEAEMMTRYDTETLNGKTACLQRIHVTGGTNGILIDSLRRHRPFVPSFIGRAEDQAYILSSLFSDGPRLAYVHKDGLFMRHDKHAFAQEAIQTAHIGKLIGDYIRILYFTAYAKTLNDNLTRVKDITDPFTGCFISRIPLTVVYLRFALKAAALFSGNPANPQGLEFVTQGAQRIKEALDFIQGENSELRQQYERERKGWNLYYDTLDALEDALSKNDAFAKSLQDRAADIISQCALRSDIGA